MRAFGFAALLVLCLGAVIGLLARPLPEQAPPRPFQVARNAYERVEAGVTPVAQLPGLGFDLSQGDRLSYLATIEQLMPENSNGFDSLAPEMRVCLEARDRCQGYRFAISGLPAMRAVLVIQAGLVAHKSLEGSSAAETAALD
ncbi:MAG TPA: hypothetical protein VGM68_06115 [Rhizomicrobium sp.]|jgi:hypothetical protein